MNFEKAVQINHEIGSLQGEANQLLNLGSTYRWMGDMNNALEFCQRSVELHTKISYRQGQANAYSVMGNIYLDGNDYTKAFDHFQKALAIYKEADYKIGIITQLNQIGVLYVITSYSIHYTKLYDRTTFIQQNMLSDFQDIGQHITECI